MSTMPAPQPWGIRRMTPNEKGRASIGLVACETAACQNQADYVAVAYGQVGFLCSECKNKFVKTMMDKTLPELEGSEA